MKLRILALGLLAGAGLVAQAQAHDGDHDRGERGWQQREAWRRGYDERGRHDYVRPGYYGYYGYDDRGPVVVERPRYYYAPPVYAPPVTYPYGYYPYGSGLSLSLNVPLR